jgi:mannose/cellobiose epimerase-like protein (N-acyl-D-glucosamine 2-epimerase family)
LDETPDWIKGNFGRDDVRIKLRQTYFYGVAYHVTDDPKMLHLARDGATFLRKNAFAPATGGAISYWDEGAPQPETPAIPFRNARTLVEYSAVRSTATSGTFVEPN